MTDRSVAPPAHTTTPLDPLMERIEQELERLKEKRPRLFSRIDRAANLLVTHLTCRHQRQQVIRVRVRQGRPRFLVAGSKGSVYVVDPETWKCSCPDFHRRDAACKHVLAVYALVRATRPRLAPELVPCTSCRKVLPHSSLIEVTEDDASLTWFVGDRLCKVCLVATGGIS